MKKLFVLIFIMAGTLATFAQQDGGNGDPNEIRTFMGHNNSVGGYGATYHAIQPDQQSRCLSYSGQEAVF